MITQYESEWFWNAAKWNELDPLLASEDGQKSMQWEKEKERIEQLSWWRELAGKHGISADGKAWHLQTTALITSLKKSKIHPFITIDGISTELDFLYLYEGNDISDTDIRAAAAELKCEPGLIYAIAKQESAHFSFISVDGEKIPSILYERHQFSKRVNNQSLITSQPDIYGPAYKRAKLKENGNYEEVKTGQTLRLKDVYGPSGRFQYERLMSAYAINQEAALKSCSWGKFQIMGFNYESAGFNSVKEFTFAMSLGDSEHIKAFLKFAKSNSILINGLRNKNFEKIAEGHNGSNWKTLNPEYAQNIEKFYNEYNKK